MCGNRARVIKKGVASEWGEHTLNKTKNHCALQWFFCLFEGALLRGGDEEEDAEGLVR